jgi:hypothetical protein
LERLHADPPRRDNDPTPSIHKTIRGRNCQADRPQSQGPEIRDPTETHADGQDDHSSSWANHRQDPGDRSVRETG